MQLYQCVKKQRDKTSKGHIFGAEWAGTSDPAWTRTDDAAGFADPNPYYAIMSGTPSSPFDDYLPWSGMKRVEDSEAGTLVEIPKFWYKWTRDGVKMKLQIADHAESGFFVSPAHADRGDGKGERDVVYVGAYHCVQGYKSTTGVRPFANVTINEFRTNIHYLGTTIWQWDFAMYWTIMMLYLVEFAHWNSQAKIGYGCGNGSSVQNNGITDSMTYHTGTNATNRVTYGHTRYRYIEDFWGNVFDFVDGIYLNNTSVYCIKNPADFEEKRGATLVGTSPSSNGWISKWTNPSVSGFEYALYPNAINGSDSTYICDFLYSANNPTSIVCVGGNYNQVQNFGVFSLSGSQLPTFKNATYGSRLMKLP